MTPDDFWNRLRSRYGVAEGRDDFRFDPDYYRAAYPDLAEMDMALDIHWEKFGRSEGRRATAYRADLSRYPDLHHALDALVRDPELAALMDAFGEEGYELAYEAIRLRGPVDRHLSVFSGSHYRQTHADIAAYEGLPFEHYMHHGRFEGRKTAAALLSRLHVGRQVADDTRPLCLIILHDLSRTGAPMVGLELIEQASHSHTVHVIALRDGPLLERALDHCTQLLITADPDFDARLLMPNILSDACFAILNSAECAKLLPMLVAYSCDIVSYIHEFPDYILPRSKALSLVAFSRLLVFSSDRVRESWGPLCADCALDVDRDVAIVSQRRLKVGRPAPSEIKAAKNRVGQTLGEDLTGRQLVLGAGEVSPRKGTGDFLLAAQLHAHSDPDTLFVWIGSGWDPDDIHFGVWFQARYEAMHASSTAKRRCETNIRFLPPGPLYDDLMTAADLFFLPSVLDPLPNVVFDAAEAGTPVLLFDRATGFDDETYRGSSILTRVPAGDLMAISNSIAATPKKSERTKANKDVQSEPVEDAADSIFSVILTAYRCTGGNPDPSGSSRKGLHRQARSQAQNETCKSGAFRVSLLFEDTPADSPQRVAERAVLCALGRMPFWPDPCRVADAISGASEPWTKTVELRSAVDGGEERSGMQDTSLHCHVSDIEAFGILARTNAAVRQAVVLVLTADTDTLARQVARTCKTEKLATESCRTSRTPFEDFITLAAQGRAEDIWGHFVADRVSRPTLASNPLPGSTSARTLLSGTRERLPAALDAFRNSQTAAVGALDLTATGWGRAHGALQLLRASEQDVGPRLPPDTPFPIAEAQGFWVRSAAAASVADMLSGLPQSPNPASTGVMAEAARRLWSVAAARLGMRFVLLHDALPTPQASEDVKTP